MSEDSTLFRRRRRLAVAALAALASLGAGATLAKLATAGTTGTGNTTGNAAGGAAGDAPGGAYRSGLPHLGALPALDGATTWLNSAPLTTQQLRGKVVLVDFWTYSCINCIRTLPHVRAWAQKYRDQGLVVIGVHTPEFSFEQDAANVSKAVERFQIDYPIAVDSERRIWNAYRNNAWPVFYVADAQGQVRARLVGEGTRAVEQVIQMLLAEAGRHDAMGPLATPQATDEQAAPDGAHLGSGETYVGYEQAAHFVGRGGLRRDVAHDYTAGAPGLNEWSLTGDWTVGAERAQLNRAGGGIVYRFSARDLHLVLGPGADGKPVRFVVSIDGRAPGADHGTDTDAAGHGVVTATRLYQLVRQSGTVQPRTFEIRFLDPGAGAFAFTFG
ncbi:thioredoxin family protein [Duganella sp. LX20W]|uniref:Thioredoxin family protein n=1 Tax=Rugamonas brunnea TaxID=2758569 RepID=A0A7W2EUP5_9BURK|nr:thioredoxin family protein [Rugamonas brunnea]